ncbi:MAG TPA: hypothetical protein VMU31_09855 [Rhizomicrobium sp.]|nr:hypothetical protein [Rhizomicrobium sp.]
MRYWRLLLLLPLAGCSYTMYLSGADEHGGTVNMVTEMGQDAALQKAKDHCAQYHLDARVLSTDLPSGTMRFSCQPAE